MTPAMMIRGVNGADGVNNTYGVTLTTSKYILPIAACIHLYNSIYKRVTATKFIYFHCQKAHLMYMYMLYKMMHWNYTMSEYQPQ